MNRQGRTPTAPIVRFSAKVDMSDPDACWIWQGSRDKDGYGVFWDGKRDVKAYRWSYEHFVGPIPEGLQNDHLCRQPSCVNPEHIEPVTPRENSLRSNNMAARNARRTHCVNGHPLTGDNLIRDAGRRRCRTCHLAAGRATKARRRAARIASGAFGKKARSGCINGHPFTPETTTYSGARGRVCRICARARNAAYEQRRREKAA